MRVIMLISGATLALGLTGCSTFFNSAAAAPTAGEHYAVGSKAGFFSTDAKVWICKDGNASECEEVQVVEK